MSNIKVAFSRYLDIQATQRRASMLRWLKIDHLEAYKRIERSMIIPSLIELSREKLARMRNHLLLCRKEFSTTRYFENNFDIMVNRSMVLPERPVQVLLDKYNEGEAEKQTAIKAVPVLFDRLYQQNRFTECHELLTVPLSCFEFTDFSRLLNVIDKTGTVEQLLELFAAFKHKRTLPYLSGIVNLRTNELLSSLLDLNDPSKDPAVALDELLSHDLSPNAVSLLTIICSSRLPKGSGLIDKLMMSDLPKDQFDSRLVRRIYKESRLDYEGGYQLLQRFVNDENRTALLTKVFKGTSRTVFRSVYVWSRFFPDAELQYNSVPNELGILKNACVFFNEVPSKLPDLDPELLGKLMSILIFGHVLWGSRAAVETLYKYKEEHGLLTESDKRGMMRKLAFSGDFESALSMAEESGEMESPEVLDASLLAMSQLDRWDDLKVQYDKIISEGVKVPVEVYTKLFSLLASRSADEQMLNLWDSFLSQGYKPNDAVLSSMIEGLIRKKDYTRALQWFTAYSYYKVNLSDKSYGLMLHALACNQNFDACFKLLDELIERKISLSHKQILPLLQNAALLGDNKAVERVLSNYYPQFGLDPKEGKHWILVAHHAANRFAPVVSAYWNMVKDHTITVEDTCLALEAARRLGDLDPFYRIWESAIKCHKTLPFKAYVTYMAVHVRVCGMKQTKWWLNKIRKTLEMEKLPVIIYNQMIFSAICKNKPELTPKILKLLLDDNVKPTVKTYSLVLESNCLPTRYGKTHIKETLALLDEVFASAEKDGFGKLQKDLSPVAFMFVIRWILQVKGVDVARKYFDLYVGNSKNYVLDNLQVLHTELLLLGEEERWGEFSGCYDRYLSLLQSKIAYARGKKGPQTAEEPRLSFVERSTTSVSATNLETNRYASVKIPNNLKKAMFAVWPYRLRQLERMEGLERLPEIVEQLFEHGVVLSNDNMNEAALKLSENPKLVQVTVDFIDKFLYQGYRKLVTYKARSVKYGAPMFNKPEFYLKDDGTCTEIVKNIKQSLSTVLTGEMKRVIVRTASVSRDKTIMKMVRLPGKVIFDANQARYHLEHNRKLWHKYKRWNLYNEKRRWARIEVTLAANRKIDYKKRLTALIEKKQTAQGDELVQVQQEMANLTKERKRAIVDMRETLKQEKLEKTEVENSKEYRVGRVNLYRLNDRKHTDDTVAPSS